uniref:Uncharacterized protein n=1 Tax=Trichogramma kaykai TaxID=54128 RepID=A0ABD2WVN5_9HYME
MAQVHGKIEEKDHEFLRHLYSSIRDYHGQLPNLRDIFRPEAIEWLLTESVTLNSKSCFVDDLFKIYDKFDVNYTDEDGLTQFHAACQNGCDDVVEKFLDLGQDPNLLVTKTDELPLYLALSHSNEEVFKLLLRRGADPNLVGHNGCTILHDIIIYQKYHDEDFLDTFFKIIKEVDQVVEVDVRNEWDLTPLELAVLNFFPDVIDVLFDHGADLSDFVFPSEDDFNEKLEIDDIDSYFLVSLASGILAVVERLEKRG